MKKEVEIIITPLYKPKTYQRRLSMWSVRLIIAGCIFFILLAGLGVYLLYYANQQNMAIRYLYERNFTLEQENKKVTELQNQLKYLETERAKIALMLGSDKNPPPIDLEHLDEVYQPLEKPEISPIGARFQVAPTTGYIISRGVSKGHAGVDFAAQLGIPVFAIGSGVVEDVGIDTFYGNFIRLDLGDGYHGFYGHLYKIVKVKDDTVNAGDIVGYVGSSGKSSAPHLHFELWQIKDGKQINLDPESELKSILKPKMTTKN